MKSIQQIVGVLVALVAVSAHARLPWVPTDAEMASLPPYCKAKMKAAPGSPEYSSWEATLGKDFSHTHHYCAGINFINRYYGARSTADKRATLKDAQTNLQYMVTHADPGYSLMPEVYLNLGVVYSLNNQPAQAITHFNKAIELNPKLPRAYTGLADYYLKSKQKAKALETVTEGLRHNPGTRSLQRRYTELGGKLPYPEPVVAEVKPDQSSPVEASAVDAPAGDTPVGAGDKPVAAASVSGAVEEPPEAAAASPEIVKPKIGSPTNPYCRFCPD